MLFRFNKDTLEYYKISIFKIIMLKIVIFFGLMISLSLGLAQRNNNVNDYTEKEIMIITNNYNAFTSEKFINEIKRRNFKFPHIVYAQSILESTKFTSDIFKYNNNLFGMRQARVRINTAVRTQRNHAYYLNWRESLEDYGYYCATYLSNLKTEDEYFNYLAQNYAEEPEYVNRVKSIIKTNELEKLFGIDGDK